MSRRENKMTSEFMRKFEQTRKQHPLFGELAIKYLDERGIITASEFEYRTKIRGSLYYDLVKNPGGNRTFETVIAFCAAINADLDRTEYMLKLVGLSFNPCDIEHQAYKEIIVNYQGKSVIEKNAFLVSLNDKKITLLPF